MFVRFLGFFPETSEDRRRRPQLHPGAPTLSTILERWQNGIALASKASARKGLGVRIPRAPFMKMKTPEVKRPWGFFHALKLGEG